jgi:poly(3-hydroxybutyrate) depolymerase
MLYTLYEMQRASAAPLRLAAKVSRAALRMGGNPFASLPGAKAAIAAADLFESITRPYGKPEWGLDDTRINGVTVPVTPTVVWRDTWCELLHFRRDPDALASARKPGAGPDPRVLIVAPLSGHYATLLRGTVEAFLPDHEVFITDWADARMVSLVSEVFDLDAYVTYVRRMLEAVGPGAAVLGVCQPGPPVLAAVALMAEDNDPARPSSMIFMGSPIDTRRSPTVPNVLAMERPFSWFEEKMISTVPWPYPGMLRRVYPGFIQLASFMNMNWERHVDAHWSFFNHLVQGDGDNAEKHRDFYDEYLSVLDLSSEFYLDTIKRVFQDHEIATGRFRHRGRLVRPEAIRDVALMTVEGEKDDISGIGQTQAAHDLCVNLPKAMQLDYVQPGVGHYGVFNGNRFRAEIVPRVREFIRTYQRTAANRTASAA